MRWTVGTKIGAGFGLALLILLAIGATSYRATLKMSNTAYWVDHTHQVIEDLAAIRQNLSDAQGDERAYVITGDPAYTGSYDNVIGVAWQTESEVRGLTTDKSVEQHRLQDMELILKQLQDWFDKVNGTVKAKGPDAGRQLVLTDKGVGLMKSISTILDDMRQTEKDLLQQREDDANATARNARVTIIAGTMGAIVLLSLAALLITGNIAGPLKQITSTAGRIAEGDLSVKVLTNHRSDEVGQLVRSFSRMSESLAGMAATAQRIAEGDLRVEVKPQSASDVLGNAFAAMVENLQKMISQFSETVNILSSSANQISTSTTQLAAGAAQTATAVSEATTTVEEVRQTAQLTSQKAKLVSDTAQRTAEISALGAQSTDETVAGMNRIRQQVDSIAQTIVRVSEQGQAIGQIVTTVEDLAAQSNLLAVNASIEAAKAGEQGRGFSVVAQEVRSLAEQSKQATNQVKAILGDIQKATSAAVMATEQGSKAAEAGVQQAGRAGESIQTLSSSVGEAAQAATQIAASSQQQLVGVDQVASAMESIKQASTQNVASAKQLEAAAHNLNELGHKLKQTAERYKL
jgi:methyl-accepting chemotaxis protein